MAALPASKLDSGKPVLLAAGQSYLRKVMRERGMTVTALAKEVGVSRKHLSNVLNRRAPLIDPLLHRLVPGPRRRAGFPRVLPGPRRAAGTRRVVIRLHEGVGRVA